jgi:hypothetical protein
MDQELKSYLDSKFAESRAEMDAKFAEMRTELSADIEKVETNLLRAFHGWSIQPRINADGRG